MKRLSVIIFSCLFTSFLPAQNPVRAGKDYAYFFYVTTFHDRGWDPLPETQYESEDIAAELRENYSFKTEIIPNPTKQQVLDKITQVNRNINPDDQVLFFFSTHGHFQKETERGYLIPSDGKVYDPYGASWISYDDLGSYVTLCPSRHVMLALDACYSGAFGFRWKGSPGDLPWDKSVDCNTKITNALRWDSRLYFSSGSKEQRTPAQSKFASRWLEALRRGHEEGVVRTKDLRYYLSDIEYPKPEGGSFSGKHQEGGDFVFVHKNACANISNPSKPTDDQSHWLSIQSNFSRENLATHLELFPNCQHQSVLNSLGIGALQIESDKAPAPKDSLSGKPATLEVWGSSGSKNTIAANMILVKSGSFSPGAGRESNRSKLNLINVRDFYMAKYEVTFEEYDEFCIETGRIEPSDNGWGRGKRPVVNVSWNDAIEYCNWKSKKEQLDSCYEKTPSSIKTHFDKNGYRLPTEEEWEYAAQIIEKQGIPMNSLAWYANNSNRKSQQAGEKMAPELGLHDLLGNAAEWTNDWFSEEYRVELDDKDQDRSKVKIVRGGSWKDMSRFCTAGYRAVLAPDQFNNYTGFRTVRSKVK